MGFQKLAETDRSLDEKPVPDEKIIKVLEGVFTRPWFGRVWIIQEIDAAQEAVVFCGRDAIFWSSLRNACKEIHLILSQTSARSPYIDTYFQRADTIRRALDLNNISTARSQLKRNLLFLLGHLGHCEASNPRDKVYGILGLANESHQEAELEAIVPDYEKSVVEVYSELVKTLVLNTGRLDILRFCTRLRRMDGLPSWAPFWTCTAVRYGNSDRSDPSKAKICRLPADLFPEMPVTRFSEDMSTMTVEGFIIGFYRTPILTEILTTPSNPQDLGDADNISTYLLSMENILASSHDKEREEGVLRSVDIVTLREHGFIPGPCETCAVGVQRGDLFCMFVGASEAFIIRPEAENGVFVLLGVAGGNSFYLLLCENCLAWFREGILMLQEFRLK